VNSIERRISKLEKKRRKEEKVFCMLVLHDGDPDPPKIQDPNVFTFIMDLRQNRQGKDRRGDHEE
jgi:hypothetical protein